MLGLKKIRLLNYFFQLLIILMMVQFILFYQSSLKVVKFNQVSPNLVFLTFFLVFLIFDYKVVFISLVLISCLLDYFSTAPTGFYFIVFTGSILPLMYLYNKFFNKINLSYFLILVTLSSLIKMLGESVLLTLHFDFIQTIYFLREVGFQEMFLNIFFSFLFYFIFFLFYFIFYRNRNRKIAFEID